MESINYLNEVKLLGYFETIKSVFLLKFVLLTLLTKEANGTCHLDSEKIPADVISTVQSIFNDDLFYRALQNENQELHANFTEDMVTAALGSSWIVFEQLIKDLNKPNYSISSEDISVVYQSGRFQFNAREKKDLDLFYYIRNATQHYNGAYYAYKEIDHRFSDADFKSAGHYGEKIEVNIRTAWDIICTLEKYAMKAFENSKKIHTKHSTQ